MIDQLIDPMGMLVTELRAAAPITDIVATRISTDEAPEADQLKSRVVLHDAGLPNGLGRPGARRYGQQLALYIAKCYGPIRDALGRPIDTGPITARQIAGTVAAAVHQKGPRQDGQGRIIHMTNVIGISPKLTDPDTKEPYYEVLIETTAGAQVAA